MHQNCSNRTYNIWTTSVLVIFCSWMTSPLFNWFSLKFVWFLQKGVLLFQNGLQLASSSKDANKHSTAAQGSQLLTLPLISIYKQPSACCTFCCTLTTPPNLFWYDQSDDLKFVTSSDWRCWWQYSFGHLFHWLQPLTNHSKVQLCSIHLFIWYYGSLHCNLQSI